MATKKYKIGNLVYEIICPIDYEEKEPVSNFLTDEERTDYTVNVELVDELPQNVEKPIYDTVSKCCTEIGDELCCYFRDTDSFGKDDKIYARKKMKYGEKQCTISVLKSMQHKICSRLLIILMSMEELTTENDCVIFHSSYINLNGKAIIFTGPCGIGKSTQADLWQKYRNTPIINGDKSLLYIENSVAMAGGLPFSGSSEYCDNLNLPIGAIVKLGKAKKNKANLETGFEAFNTILRSCYPVTYSQNLINRQIDFAEKFSEKVPVIHFECTPDESAVNYLEDKLWQVLNR